MTEIPVYLFLGFLDGGKTKFIQDTMCDERFQTKERTLCILFEDGDEELDTSKYKGGKNVTVVIAKGKELIADKLEGKNVVKEIYVPGRIVNIVVK